MDIIKELNPLEDLCKIDNEQINEKKNMNIKIYQRNKKIL